MGSTRWWHGTRARGSAPGATLDEAALKAYLEGKMSGYKIPHRFVFFDEMPKSSYGKITKKIIRQASEDRGLLDTGAPA